MPFVGSGLARSGLARLTCRERRDPFRSGKHRVGTFVTHATDVSDGGAPMTGRLGHDDVAANVVWRKVGSRAPAHHVRMEQTGLGTDRFEAVVAADEPGLWTFRVDAWSDPWATWRNAVTKKLDAGQGPDELANDLETGARLLQRVGRRPAERPNRDLLFGAANALRDTALPLHARVAPALFPAVHAIMTE